MKKQLIFLNNLTSVARNFLSSFENTTDFSMLHCHMVN